MSAEMKIFNGFSLLFLGLLFSWFFENKSCLEKFFES